VRELLAKPERYEPKASALRAGHGHSLVVCFVCVSTERVVALLQPESETVASEAPLDRCI